MSRELVHRRAVTEVFPTAIVRVSISEYTVSAQRPRWHVFYDGLKTGFDSDFVVETLRQLTVLIAHTQFAVPLGRPFLMPHMAVRVVQGRRRDRSRPADVKAQVKVSGQRHTPQGLVAFRTDAVFSVDGHEIAVGNPAARIVDPGVYFRFRTSGPIRLGTLPGGMLLWAIPMGQGGGRCWWLLPIRFFSIIRWTMYPVCCLLKLCGRCCGWNYGIRVWILGTSTRSFLAVLGLGIDADVVLESLTEQQDAVTAVVSVRSEAAVVMRTVARVV